MIARILTHKVQIDEEILSSEGMVIVNIESDNTFDIQPFKGVESASTIFVSGTVYLKTDGKGRLLSVTGGQLKFKF